MKTKIFFSLFLLPSFCSFAQLPESDIWLFDIKDSAGQVVFSNPVNITHKKGYDNQPAFSPDGTYLLFASQPEGSNATDIYKYDLQKKTTTRLTNTPESEYSPGFVPDGKNISVVKVEKDSTQRLWQFPLAGGEQTCILKNIKEVGYHCWIDKNKLALFILTKPAFTLQIADVKSEKTTVIADSIGKCLRMRDNALWFTTKAGHFSNVYARSFKTNENTLLGMIEGEDFYFRGKEVWSFSDNTIVSGYMSSKAGAAEILNLEKFGITSPSRVAVSPDGKKMVVVSGK